MRTDDEVTICSQYPQLNLYFGGTNNAYMQIKAYFLLFKTALFIALSIIILSSFSPATVLSCREELREKDTLPPPPPPGEVVPMGKEGNIFEKVEVEAAFPGGLKAWSSFLMENLDAEVPVRNKAKVGRYVVIVQFIVGKDGSISDIKALTKHGHGMEKEVIRIIKKSPNWTPAYQGGRAVRAYRKQPIIFEISE